MRHRLKIAFPALSAALCVALTLCYALRPDAFAAVTFFPAWVWVPGGIILALPGLAIKRMRVFALVLLLWIAYAFAFSEEPRSMVRHPAMSSASFQSARRSCRGVRVVSLNCAGGSLYAASEVARYHPDIVLLQESPDRSDVAQLARKLFGKDAGFAYGVDASVLARGRVKVRWQPLDLSAMSTFASVRLASGMEVEVVSLRLVPPVFRMDLWSPECWRDQMSNRQTRRKQLRQIAEAIDALPTKWPIIAGGDFNAPAGDAIYRVLRPRLHDTFAEHGVGWGNTVLNDTPVQRFDEVWASSDMRAVSVIAYQTENSDHRLVVCDMAFR